MSFSHAENVSYYLVNPEGQTGGISGTISGKDWEQSQQLPEGSMVWACVTRPEGDDTGIDTDAAWAKLYAEDQDRTFMNNDGTEFTHKINELQTVVDALAYNFEEAQEPLKYGIWIGGQKHTLTTKKTEEASGGHEFLTMVAMRRGQKGHVICCSDPTLKGKSLICTVEFADKEGVSAYHAKTLALTMMKEMVESGMDKIATI